VRLTVQSGETLRFYEVSLLKKLTADNEQAVRYAAEAFARELAAQLNSKVKGSMTVHG
jgi:hypothetical protein